MNLANALRSTWTFTVRLIMAITRHGAPRPGPGHPLRCPAFFIVPLLGRRFHVSTRVHEFEALPALDLITHRFLASPTGASVRW